MKFALIFLLNTCNFFQLVPILSYSRSAVSFPLYPTVFRCGRHRWQQPMMVFASYKYAMFHLPWTKQWYGPTTRSSSAAAVEAGKEAVRRSPKHFCCGCDRERTAKYKAKDSVSVEAGQFTIIIIIACIQPLCRVHRKEVQGRCNDLPSEVDIRVTFNRNKVPNMRNRKKMQFEEIPVISYESSDEGPFR